MAMRKGQQQAESDFCQSIISNSIIINNNNSAIINRQQSSQQQPRHRRRKCLRRPYTIFTVTAFHVGLLIATLSSTGNMMRLRRVSAWSLSPSTSRLKIKSASSSLGISTSNSNSLTMSIDSRELRFYYGRSSSSSLSPLDNIFRHQQHFSSSSSSSSSATSVLEHPRQQRSDAFIAVAEGARNIASMSFNHQRQSSATVPVKAYAANSKHPTATSSSSSSSSQQLERTTTTTVTKTTVYASSSRKARTTTTTTTSCEPNTSFTVRSAAAAIANSIYSSSCSPCSSSTCSMSSRYGLYQSFPFSTGKEQDESSSSFPSDSSFPSSAFFSPSSADSTWDQHDSSSSLQFPQQQQQHNHHRDYMLPQRQGPKQGYGTSIQLTEEECALFSLLRQVRCETGLDTTLRVAGGWVRDKLLATPEFQTYHTVFDVGAKQGLLRLTSKFRKSAASSQAAYSRTTGSSSAGRQGTKVLLTPRSTTTANGKQNDHHAQPVDIDIALDDMLGREFADHLNEYLTAQGAETVSVGVVLKNPEKSKHLETATMKVGSFWIDFVNLRAEEYTQDSRIPDLMRIGSASEDAFRRDLTINALFYNINTGQVEDWTGRGFDDLRKGIVATPLPPLTTLLDDPLRVLRSVRFAARLRFDMDEELCAAARDASVKDALAQKVSRERVGSEVDLMLRSPDPVGAMRLLIDLNLVDTVFPVADFESSSSSSMNKMLLFNKGLSLLTMAHDHLADCRWSPPLWCKTVNSQTAFGSPTTELRLIEDEETRRLLWYAAFLKPIWDEHQLAIRREEVAMELAEQQQAVKAGQKVLSSKQRKAGRCKKENRSPVTTLLVDHLKRPIRDSEAIGKIIKAADDITDILNAGGDISSTMILLSDVRVVDQSSLSSSSSTISAISGTNECSPPLLLCSMNSRTFDSATEDDPVWEHAMEFRLQCSKVLKQVGPLWRAALFLALSQELDAMENNNNLVNTMEGGDAVDERHEEHRGTIVERFDVFAAALQQLGLIGIWNQVPLINGVDIQKIILPRIPKGPTFGLVMEEQDSWMTTHPGASSKALQDHLRRTFPLYTQQEPEGATVR